MPKKNQGRAANPRPKNKPAKKTLTTKKPVQAAIATKPQTTFTKLPNVLQLAKSSFLICWRNRKTLSVIVLIYGLVYLVFVLGLSGPGNNVTSLKSEFNSFFHGDLKSFYSGLSVFTYLVGSSASSSTPGGSAYEVFITIIASLSIIWSLRQFYLGTKIRARDGYYQGLFPLAQFVLVLLFIALELLPLVAGIGLYGLLISGGIAVTILEKLLSIMLVITLVTFSFYLVSASIISIYIVTLPAMTPMKALRSAKNLVKGRRWSVFRKIIFLPLLLFIAGGIVMLPFIIILPSSAAWIFFILTLVALVYIHSYLYSLYRGLINEQA